MKLKGRKIGVAITGSFCTYEKVFQALRALKKEEAELQTIFSDAAQSIDLSLIHILCCLRIVARLISEIRKCGKKGKTII